MLGIENLKKAVKFASDLGEEVENCLKDGKFKAIELFKFLDELLQIPNLINSRADIIAEYKDLTEQERQDLLAYTKEVTDLEDDKLEERIENSLDVVFALLKLITPPAIPDSTEQPTGGDEPTKPPPVLAPPADGGQG